MAQSSRILEETKRTAIDHNRKILFCENTFDQINEFRAETITNQNINDKILLDSVVGFRHIEFEHNVTTMDLSVNIQDKLLSNSDVFNDVSVFHKSCLFFRNKLRQDEAQPISNDFGQDQLYEVAKAYRTEIRKGNWVFLLWDKDK